MNSKKSNTDTRNSIKSQENADSRRSFFKRFGLVGAAAAAGGAAIYSGYNYEETKPNRDMVKVLTADNKLVEVPRDQI